MKKYRDFITEKRDTLMALSPYGFHYGDEDALRITGLVNPSRGELEGFINRTKHKSARFLLHDGKLLVWDAADAIHADVLEGEYRLGKGALYKLANNNKKFAHGVFLTTPNGLEVRVIEPAKWVSSLLRKDSKTKHIVGPDVEVIATDDNGMPLDEEALNEAPYSRKGWVNLKSGKMILWAFRGGTIRPFHDEYVVNNAKKFFRGGEDELLRRFAAMNGFEPEDDETISMWVDIKTGKVDRDPNLDSVMEEDGWRRVVFDQGISSMETMSRSEGQKLAKIILSKMKWDQIQSISIYDQGHLNDSIDIYNEEDFASYAKTGRVPRRTEIGSTMAMFRGEDTEISQIKKYSEFMSEGTYAKSGLGKWMNQQSAGGGPGWDRYNEKGERVGKCGDAKEGEAYAACLSKQKADKLGKEKIADFVKRKRAAQRKAGDAAKGGEEKKGQKPVFVKTGVTDLKDSYLEEKNVPLDPALWKRAISQAKSRFDVYPSAYANAWAAKWYKGKGGKWRTEEECDCDCDEIIETAIIHEEDGKKKEVKLNDPFRTPGGPKKFAVYVKNDKGNIVLVRFGDPNLSIKRDDPERLKSFRARHGCDEDPGPKWKAKYWSCKFWEKDKPVSGLLKKGKVS